LQLNEVEIKDGRRLRATVCAPNLRLFVGNIPKCKGKSEIFQEASKATGKLRKSSLCYALFLLLFLIS
jgi:hypothetical protein